MSFFDAITFRTWEVSNVSIEAIEAAYAARDPELAHLIVDLAGGRDRAVTPKPREGAPTLNLYLRSLRSLKFKKLGREERKEYRRAEMAKLAAEDAEVGLPERFALGPIIERLYAANTPYERETLLRVIEHIPLRWGPWRALKRIFKQSEEAQDYEVWGALVARFDAEFANPRQPYEVTKRTLGYLVRRAWRTLRRIAEGLPAAYPDVASACLARYSSRTHWGGTWVANHIFHHEDGRYSRRRFKRRWFPRELLTNRAYGDLWRRSPRPLFGLLERASSPLVRNYAINALKKDFRAAIREVEPDWVVRLLSMTLSEVHDFAVWVLQNVPRFEEGSFRELGLHEPVLSLLRSPSSAAKSYSASYARAHARDLGLEELLEFTNDDHEDVRALARDLLRERDPRKEVGLDSWGKLLGTRYGHKLAERALAKHFGARELTPEWFIERLVSDRRETRRFAQEQLFKVHKLKKLGVAFFQSLCEHETLTSQAAQFALGELVRFDVSKLEVGFLRYLMLQPHTRRTLVSWIEQERVKAESLGVDFLKTLAFHPQWDEDKEIATLKTSKAWAEGLDFDTWLRDRVLEWFSDIRLFSPEDMGFDWLMQLVSRSEPAYHEFAVEYMIKAFLPADFAESSGEPEPEPEPTGEINIDLGGATFVFTGKLKTMTRREAQGKVKVAGGKKGSGVSKKLDYLVIGDEGSPLYGQGRKGAKQLKGEKVIASGGALRIISETAFLQMLAGEQREFSEESVEDGCQRLWEMATAPGAEENPLARFSLRYMKRHHKDIGLAMSDRPVDPGAEIPDDFLSFERVKPLFFETRPMLRAFALELAKYEFARWAPPIEEIVSLSEAPDAKVRAFVAKALLADDRREHKRYRVDPKILTPEAVYSFCESLDDNARALGMRLIDRDPKLAVPEELFRLTESPDRQVRAFVIEKIWALYRGRASTEGWKPAPKAEVELASRRKKKKKKAAEVEVGGAPRPKNWPAEQAELQDFMRRVLFEIPPGRSKAEKKGSDRSTLKPLPSGKAKRLLVEVLRDLALIDADFAKLISPLLEEFMASRGKSERAACLVALTRIHRAHPELSIWPREDVA